MEFDIGNLIYILITLVAVIIGLAGKKKKPAGDSAAGEEEPPRSGFLENLERAFNLSEEDSQVVRLREDEADLPAEEGEPAPSYESTEPLVSPGSRMMDNYERLMQSDSAGELEQIMREGQSMTDPIEVIDLDEQEGTNYFDIVRDFDAGTAVIYSAIINRVDY